MWATVGAALKKIAVALLGNPKVLKTIGGIVLGLIIIIVMPVVAIVSIFNGDIEIDTNELQRMVVENLSAEEQAKLQFVEDTMYANATEKGTIDTIPEIPGLAVWHEGHIGIYIGGGKVIEAMGTKYGVVETELAGRGWTHWLKVPYITYLDTEMSSSANEKHIWDTLYAKIGNPYGVAGLMGNLYAESALRPDNLQGSFEDALGHSDASYTQAVDSGAYTGFATDSAGYGLAQWTASDRKESLLAYAKEQGKSIGDLDMQLDFLYHELETKFPDVLAQLKNATSVRAASDSVLLHFEMPKDQSASVQAERALFGSTYYERYR